jgi:hypothetical protein
MPKPNQKELISIFKKLKKILKTYEKPLVSHWNLDSKYDLWSEKEITIGKRIKKEVYFAGLIIQSSYVGFYFMPIYTDSKLKDVFQPELLKTLKGKSCFHITYLDNKLESQIKTALKKGYSLYKKRGWI